MEDRVKYNPTSWIYYLRFLNPPNCDHPDAQLHKVYQHCRYGRWSNKKRELYGGVPFFWFDMTKPDARNQNLFRITWEARKGKWKIV
jgi:hypothetical protein